MNLLNKYTDRFVFWKVDPKYHSIYKLVRNGAYDSERVSMYGRAALWLSVNGVRGDVCEFGTTAGESFLSLYSQLKGLNDPMPHFHLFDSFAGLPGSDPRTSHPGWGPGSYAYDYREFIGRMDFFGVDRDSYTAINGFYKDTLSILRPMNPLALIHIDCDLYESTKLALRYVSGFIQTGTVILFDDYYCSKGDPNAGESAAFREFLEAHPCVSSLPWYDYSIHGKAFILGKK